MRMRRAVFMECVFRHPLETVFRVELLGQGF
jgi:hypothetical protein